MLDLIDKLVSSWTFPKSIDIQVGTIHGFQGDECDVIVSVFNPPPSISSHPEMFLNNSIDNLALVKRIEKLCKNSGSYIESKSNSIEEIIFGNEHFLEENSFSTSHQLVNVYGEPEKQYEIRSEDTAVDVQIHPNGDIERLLG